MDQLTARLLLYGDLGENAILVRLAEVFANWREGSCPKPVLITKEEEKGVDVKEGSIPRVEGERLAASYVNYYCANGGIVMPLFDDPADEAAMAKMREVFPDREVVGIYAREILLGGGNIHCITQQQPKAGI